MSTSRNIVDLGSIMRQKHPKKNEENDTIDNNYVKKAFSLLDDCIERTKRESINYQIWRREQEADLEIKAEYMTKEELEEEQRKLFEFQKEHTYEILQGKYNTTGPSNSSIKKENEQQENSSNEYVEPTTTFIYEED